MIYKSIFIDLDDTLWDTYHNNKECLEELYTDYHFNRYYASFEAFFDIYMPHNLGSPDKPGGLSIQLCKSEKKEFYIRYSS